MNMHQQGTISVLLLVTVAAGCSSLGLEAGPLDYDLCMVQGGAVCERTQPITASPPVTAHVAAAPRAATQD